MTNIAGQKSMGITVRTIMSRLLYVPVVKTSDYWLKATAVDCWLPSCLVQVICKECHRKLLCVQRHLVLPAQLRYACDGFLHGRLGGQFGMMASE